jgi:thioredoxin reductase (NADPH)
MPRQQRIEGELQVVGHRWSARAHEIKAFLARSRVPYRWLDVERDEEARRLQRPEHGRQVFPVVILPDGTRLFRPDVRELAERIGLDTQPDEPFYQLIVVGGGPAGLSAAVYAASEKISTIVIEQEVPGGQAGYSSNIENYPGFPGGLSGSDFARRTVEQAEKFGVEILCTRRVTGLEVDGGYRTVTLDDGTRLRGHAVLLATGTAFRWLEAPGCSSLVGRGVYYGAAEAEAAQLQDQVVYLLGGGNAAGQAAHLLAKSAKRVVIVAPEPSLDAAMSGYLLEELKELKNVDMLPGHTVIAAEGETHLERLVLGERAGGRQQRVPADALFIFIGAAPRTEWLAGVVERDEKGFIKANDRLETSIPGVFVAGDVRAGSVSRIASAVGDGAMAVHFIGRYLQER